MLAKASGARQGRASESSRGDVLRRLALINPARLLVGSYLVLMVTGTALLLLPAAVTAPPRLSFTEALFTATSALCVTGLSVIDIGQRLSRFGQLVVMLLIQLGGLGVMTASTLLGVLLGRRISLRGRLLVAEELHQDYPSGLVRLVRMVAAVTFAIELTGAAVLFLAWRGQLGTAQSFYYGLFHAVSAFNNAGFDLWGNSLTGFAHRPEVVLTVALLLMTGGIGFSVVADLLSWRPGHRFQLHTRVALAMAGLLVALGWAVVLGLEWDNPSTLGRLPLGQRLMDAFFTAVTPRTAGFSVVPTGSLRPATLLFIMILMFVGVSPGSTGGGIKTTTLAVIGLTVKAAVRGEEDLVIFERRLPRGVAFRAITLAVAALAWVAVVGLSMVAIERFDPLAVLFEVVSAFGTVGLSTGITPQVSIASRWLLVATMLVGKVGPVTLAMALARRKERGALWRFPEERIGLG